jgi:hypothetical protein
VRTYILAVTGPTKSRTADIVNNGFLPGGGGTMPGSNLRPINISGSISEGTPGGVDLSDYPLTGSWRLMGGIVDQDNTYGGDAASLWIRIS